MAGVVLSACGSSGGSPDAGKFDSLVQQIGFTSDCSSCITSMCTTTGETCAADSECQTIEVCAGKCIIKNGTSDGLTCVSNCTPKGTSSTTSTNVDGLNSCIVGACQTPCQNG